MEDDLRKIALDLRKWAKKYKKDYVTMCVLDETVIANVDTLDKDYKKLHIRITEKEKR